MSNAAPPPVGEFDYKPLSGWALAGFGVSCFFALLVLIAAGVAIFKGTPLFFPVWMLFPAVIGFVLSYVALGQINLSEGVLSGAALARYGMWISLLSGLGYGAYFFTVGLAVTQQAERFFNNPQGGFLTLLQKGNEPQRGFANVNAAFLLTQTPSVRHGVSPDDSRLLAERFDQPEGPFDLGRLSSFRRQLLVRTLGDGGADSKIESLGTKNWQYENKSFHVTRSYRLTGPEMVVTVSLTAESQDLEDGRQWFVNWNKVQRLEAMATPWGEAMNAVRRNGYLRLGAWVAGEPAAREWKIDFDKMDETDWAEVLPSHPEARRHIKKVLSEMFGKPAPWMFIIPPDAHDELTPYEKLPSGQVRVSLPVVFKIKGSVGIADYQVRVAVRAETKEKIDPAGLPRQIDLAPVKIRVENASQAVDLKK